MADIHTIRGASLERATNEPDPHIVAMLEKMLARAKRGELLACAVAIVKRNRRTSHDYYNAGDTGHDMVAAVTYMQHDMLNDSLTCATPVTDDVDD